MKHTARNSNGFTLLELLVTTVMIAILTVIGIVSYSSVNKRSRDVKRKSDLEQIRSALEMYKSDNGAYPGTGITDSQFNPASVLKNFLVSTYIPAIPTDPNGTSSYYYEVLPASDGTNASYCVCGCLESALCDGTTVVSDTCTDAFAGFSRTANCNYYLKNP